MSDLIWMFNGVVLLPVARCYCGLLTCDVMILSIPTLLFVWWLMTSNVSLFLLTIVWICVFDLTPLIGVIMTSHKLGYPLYSLSDALLLWTVAKVAMNSSQISTSEPFLKWSNEISTSFSNLEKVDERCCSADFGLYCSEMYYINHQKFRTVKFRTVRFRIKKSVFRTMLDKHFGQKFAAFLCFSSTFGNVV